MSRRKLSAPLTLLQCRAIRTRLRRHFGLETPRRATVVGDRCNVPAQYSVGAPGWTVQVIDIVRIPSRNELRVDVPDFVEALIGQVVDGSTLNLGVLMYLDELQATEDDVDTTPA